MLMGRDLSRLFVITVIVLAAIAGEAVDALQVIPSGPV